MPRAVFYLRVSTAEQAESGLGTGAQADACTAYAARHGLELVGPFEESEGVSGTTPLDQRPGLAAALAALRPGDVLLSAKRDRIARDPMILHFVEAAARVQGARVVSAAGEGTDDDSPTSILMRRIIDGFAEYERLLIQTRTLGALAHCRRIGRRNGTVPYGLKLTGEGPLSKKGKMPTGVAVDPEGLATIAMAHRLARAGLSLRQSARALTLADRPTVRGRPWSASSVRGLLARPDPAADPADHHQDLPREPRP